MRYIVLALALVACGEAPTTHPGGTAATTATTGTAPSSDTAAVATPPLTSASSSAKAKDATSIPATESPRPSAQEWAIATTVPGEGAVDGCELVLVREWARATCKGILDFKPTGGGRPGVDYFLGARPATIEVRVRRGALLQAQGEGPAGTLAHFVSAWPEEATQPVLLSLFPAIPGVGGLYRISDAQPLPAVPSAPSRRPSDVQWVQATPVNTAPSSDRPPGCEMRMLRDWVRVQCGWIARDSRAIKLVEGLGTLGEDHFISNGTQIAELTVHLRPGLKGTANIFSNGPGAKFEVEWPNDSAAPSVVALRK